jgi:hypothetical protein
MKAEIFQRASLAIVLIGTMLMPFGTCLSIKQKTEHSCCASASETGKSAQTNCCVVRDQQPAVVVVTILPNPAPMAAAPELSPINAPFSPHESSIAAFIPPLSPPPGAFNLRI